MNKLVFSVSSIFKKHKWTFLNVIFTIVGCALILLFSGSSYITFAATGNNAKVKIILYIITFIYFFVITASNIRVGFFANVKNKKRIPIPSIITFCFFSILLFTLLSFAFNKNKSENANTYISFILTISITYFVLTSFNPLFILKCFKNTFTIVIVVDLIIFAFTYFSKTFFPTFYYATDRAIIGSHTFISSDSLTSFSVNYHGQLRLYGVLWEPSILGVVAVVAMICDVFSKDKYTILRTIILTIAVILTFSISAFLLYFFFIAIAICKKLKGYKPYYFVIGFFIVVIILIVFSKPITDFLAEKFPSIFSKIGSSKSTSFSTRLLSLKYYFMVFAKNPLFGFGGVTANSIYDTIRPASVTADTSTFGLAAASFGMAGIFYILSIFVGVFATKKIDWPQKILLAMAIFVSTSAQGQGSVLGLNIIYFLPLATVLLPKKCREYNENYYKNFSSKNVKDFVLQKNDDGTVSSNILMSFLLKGISIIIAFVTIPAYLNYFDSNNSTYGIWLAITSVLSVITVFDFGMGNGLKNKLIKNIHSGDEKNSKVIVSTTYSLTFLLGIIVSVIGIMIIFLLNDSTIALVFFKGKEASANDIFMFRVGFSIIMFAIGMQFFLKNINYILQAHQKNAITGIFMLVTNVALLLFVLIFAKVIPSNYKILSLAIAYFVFLIIPLLIANGVLFSRSYKKIKPSYSYIDFKNSKDVVSASIKFFAVQIGTLFLWSINEWVILFSFNFNADFITEYNEYYKLYSLLPIILGTIIQQPIWTALSKADVERNQKNIKKYILTILLVAALFIIFNLILSSCLSFVFDIWLGSNAPAVSVTKVLAFIAYSIIYTGALSLICICNAFSLFKAQIVTAICGIGLKIPVLVLFVLYTNVSWEIIIFINAICYLPILVGAPFEIYKYLKLRSKQEGGGNNEKISY